MQLSLIFVKKELRMAVAPGPGGQTSGLTQSGKEASAGIKTPVACRGQFVDLCLEALGWGSLSRSEQGRTCSLLLGCLTCLPQPSVLGNKHAHSCPF